jgi:3',5'-cyclic AMP phosphodiesterase CpdA
MHVSDLHAGPPFDPVLAEQVAREAHDLKPELLVVSGDLVQRADFARQWQIIKAYLQTLPEPRLIIPGNHDVPLFQALRRLRNPLSIYQREISPNLNPVYESDGLAVVGGCSAYGRTIDGGWVSPEQQETMERIFMRQPPERCRVAVLHHHVINPAGAEGRNKIRNAEQVVRMLDRCQVDLLLCGHIHVSYVGTTLDVRPDMRDGTIICQSGTTTSRRGKGRERGKNSYNVIEIDDKVIRISQHLYLDEMRRFVPVAEHVYPRRSAGSYLIPRAERVVDADASQE